MKIIHCSDIHLDSAMESNLSCAQARERNSEICATFSRMVDFAEENAVEAVLIAGDMFDSGHVSAGTADFIFDRIARARDIEFYYLRGNHDEDRRALAGREKPANLRTFSESWTYYEHGEVCIAGLEISGENCRSMYSELELSPDKTNIVMLHGQESASVGEELICLSLLRNKNINYLALGHLHSYRQEKLDNTGIWCYSGCLEGRGFDECGEKGFVLLDIKGRHVDARFVPFACRRLYDVPVDISGLTGVSEIGRAMKEAADGIAPESLVKFTLCGSFTADTQKDLNFLMQMVRPLFYYTKIKDESRLKMDKASYEHDISLKGEFVRKVMASDLSDEDREKVILAGIRALSGEEIEL